MSLAIDSGLRFMTFTVRMVRIDYALVHRFSTVEECRFDKIIYVLRKKIDKAYLAKYYYLILLDTFQCYA